MAVLPEEKNRKISPKYLDRIKLFSTFAPVKQ